MGFQVIKLLQRLPRNVARRDGTKPIKIDGHSGYLLTLIANNVIDKEFDRTGSCAQVKRTASVSRSTEVVTVKQFAQRYGWSVAKSPFTLGQLARTSNSFKLGDDDFDAFVYRGENAVFFRRFANPHTPAAVTVHLDDWPECGPQLEQVCVSLGLKYRTLDCTLNPGGLGQLVLITPGKSIDTRDESEQLELGL